MEEQIVARVTTLQRWMVDEAASCFEPSDLEHLRVLVRLAVEFWYYVQGRYEPLDGRYVCDSIFSGVSSFQSVEAAYGVLVGARPSDIEWGAMTGSAVQRDYLATFERFDREQPFEERCRLVLDLFRLQLLFAATSYE